MSKDIFVKRSNAEKLKTKIQSLATANKNMSSANEALVAEKDALTQRSDALVKTFEEKVSSELDRHLLARQEKAVDESRRTSVKQIEETVGVQLKVAQDKLVKDEKLIFALKGDNLMQRELGF